MQTLLQGRPALGLGLSLLVHAAVLAWLAHAARTGPPPTAPSAPLRVTLLRLPPPPPAPVAEPAPAPQPAPAPSARPKHRTRPSAAPRTGPAPPAAEPQREAAEAGPATVPAPAPAPSGTAPASADQGAPSFDLQAARGTARAWVKGEGRGRGGADGLGSPMRPTRSEQLGQAIERARRPDCRGAYSGLGLLAVIPLAKDAITGKGCKW